MQKARLCVCDNGSAPPRLWLQVGNTIEGPSGSYFGSSVSLSGGLLAIGAQLLKEMLDYTYKKGKELLKTMMKQPNGPIKLFKMDVGTLLMIISISLWHF